MPNLDLRLAMICGSDIPVPSCQIVIHQPKLNEISFIGEKTFFTGAQCLCLNKSMFVQDKNLLEKTTNFQIFMTIMTEPEAKEKKEAVKQVIKLLFPNYSFTITPQSLMFIDKDNQTVLIDKDNFDDLQTAFRLIFCMKDGPMDQTAFNPANDKAKAIADKIMAGRQKVSEQKGTSNTSIFSQYISVLTVGLESMRMQDLIELTMFQLYDLVERYTLYMNWDLDVRTRLAGGNPDNKPDNWMKNIH